MNLIKSILYFLCLLAPQLGMGADGNAFAIDSRYLGTWKGTWLEGMSSGKIVLELNETAGELSFTALPSFGIQPVGISKVAGDGQCLVFHTTGANGRAMRFDLKPSGDFKKLKGKAHYETLHMELELTRAP